MTTTTPMPGHDVPAEEMKLVNDVLHATQEIGSLGKELDAASTSANDRFALLVLRQAQLRRTLFDATRPLIDYWRAHDTAPDFEVVRERLLAAAAAVEDLDALRRWIEDDVAQCDALRQQMLNEPSLAETESFSAAIRSQVDDGAAPFADLREAALRVGSRVSELGAAQQQWAMRKGAEQQGIPYTEQVHDDGTRVITFDVGRPPRTPWWRRVFQRDRG